MRGVQISYLIDYPEYIPQLAQWLFEEWDAILGEKTPEATNQKTKRTHESRSVAYCMGRACRMDNFSEPPPCACMILKDAKT